jgi:serine/threonine protein kinase
LIFVSFVIKCVVELEEFASRMNSAEFCNSNSIIMVVLFVKVLPRSTTGLAMLAAYHRVEEPSSLVNQVVEAIMTPKVIYFIMPKNYGNVHSYVLANKKLGEAEAANIFVQMVMAVQHCHSKGIIIRDIKLGKFVFTDKARRCVKLESLEDVVILADPNNDNLDDKHGCPNYVSPEKAEMLKNNSKYPGKATDLWSLGVILYTMLAGR